MNIELDTVNLAIEVVLGACAIGGIVLAGVKRVVRAQLREIREDTEQLRHNGGSSVADYAKDARDTSRAVQRQVADLAELVDDAGQAARAAQRSANDAQRSADQARVEVAHHVADNAAHRRRRWA